MGAMGAIGDNACSRGLPVQASTCLQDGGLESCRSLLDQDPEDFPIRLAVCDGLVSEDNPQGAKGLMESASRVHRRSSTQQLIRRAIDNVDEYIAFQNRAEVATDSTVYEGQLRFRCLRLKKEAECKDLLFMNSEESEPNIILGEIAFEAGRFTEAVSRFKIASKTDPEPVKAKLEEALAARSNAMSPCFSGTTREALSACEVNLIPGYGDEGRIRLRIGDIHLLSKRYGDATDTYKHTSTGSTGESRARLAAGIQQCRENSIAPCNRAIDEARGNNLFRSLMPTVYKNRCLAALESNADERVREYCDNALGEMALADANEIRDILEQRAQPPEDPWQEIWRTCSGGINTYGWDTESCRSLANADVSSEQRDRVRTELDSLGINACRMVLERGDLNAARPVCDLTLQQAYLPETRTNINDMLADAEQTKLAQNNDAANPGTSVTPTDSGPAKEAPPNVEIDIAGNDPLDSIPGVYVVTY